MLRVHFVISQGLRPNAQSFPFNCCQFSLKATGSGLVCTFSTPRQSIGCTVTLEYGYIQLYGSLHLLYCSGTCCNCCWWAVRCLLHMLGQCLTHSTTYYLRHLHLCQLHHLAPLFFPWNFMPYLGVRFSLVTLKGRRYYYCCLPTVSTSKQNFQAAPAVTT